MISRETLRHVVIQQREWLERRDKGVEREILSDILRWFEDDRVLVLTGMRRVGKSTLLRQIMDRKDAWAYVNFDDDRLIDFEPADFEKLNEVLHQEYGSPEIYFFDEIQDAPKFEVFVRRLQDSGKKVVITGSNASLLSGELSTRLTGRYRRFEVYPFSFREFLAFRGESYGERDYYITDRKARLIGLLDEYMVEGGLPEYLKTGDPEYVKTLYENIIYRDIVSRYGIRRQRVLKEMVNILLSNIASRFTYNALKKSLSLSNSITVKEYISYLSSAYMLFEVQAFDYSVRRQMNSPKKIYVIDPAFNRIAGFSPTPDRGKLLENLVFLEMKRKGMEIYYYSGKRECDFIVRRENRFLPVQVSYEITDKNREREAEGLIEAANATKSKEGWIITHDYEAKTTLEDVNIRFIPALKWLLSETR